jgi:TRAP-type C4-dicarboxylate transport system permease small subunit
MDFLDRIVDVFTRVCATVGAFWALALGFLILYDVTWRAAFNNPFDGTIEIIANSMPAIVFLLLPYATFRNAHLRTTVVYQAVGIGGRRTIDTIAFSIGIIFFVSVAIGGYEDMIVGYVENEGEGFGFYRIPIWPVRGLLFVFSIIIASFYALLLAHVLIGTSARMTEQTSGEMDKH